MFQKAIWECEMIFFSLFPDSMKVIIMRNKKWNFLPCAQWSNVDYKKEKIIFSIFSEEGLGWRAGCDGGENQRKSGMARYIWTHTYIHRYTHKKIFAYARAASYIHSHIQRYTYNIHRHTRTHSRTHSLTHSHNIANHRDASAGAEDETTRKRSSDASMNWLTFSIRKATA